MKRLWSVPALLLSFAATAQDASQVRIYDSPTGVAKRFEVIKRLQVGAWTSAFGTPSFATREEGAEALRRAAAELGGNGVLNFGCYRKSEQPDAVLGCNGTVIKVD